MDIKSYIARITLLIALGHTGYVSGLTCLKCDAEADPILCKYIERCGPEEACSVEAYVSTVGFLVYRMGCKGKRMCASVSPGKRDDVGLLTCSECCTDDLCNAAGCGKTGYVLSQGPVCYNCDSQFDVRACGIITQCGANELCEISVLSHPSHSTPLYKTQCQRASMCQPQMSHSGVPIIGRKRLAQTCKPCCNSTICNDYDPTLYPCEVSTTTQTTDIVTSTTTPMVTSSTTSKATTTTSTTTAVPSTDCVDHNCSIAGTDFCGRNLEFDLKRCRKRCGLC